MLKIVWKVSIKDCCIFKSLITNINVLGNSKDSVPFPHFSLHDFIENLNAVRSLRVELDILDWQQNSNDLYELEQTRILDFKLLDCKKFPVICSFRDFLFNDVRKWLIDATGIELNDRVTINGSK